MIDPIIPLGPEDNIIDAPEAVSMRQNPRAVANATGTLPAVVNAVVELPGKNIIPASALVYLEPAAGAVAGAILARYWLDGSLPDLEKGFPLKAGDTVFIDGKFNVQNVRFVCVDGLAHILQVQYFNY